MKASSVIASSSNAIMRTNDVLDVAIIGAGLSGLLVAQHVNQHQYARPSSPASPSPPLQWKLFEARATVGGRLANDVDVTNKIDMGGAWIWPQQQPLMRNLVKGLGHQINTFAQPDDPSSTRIDGGAVRIAQALAGQLPHDSIQLNTPITSCALIHDDTDDEPLIRVETEHHETFWARHVVLAAPPKLVQKHVAFDPPLSNAKQAAMARSHTWMAAVTKIALIYQNKFWGDDASNMGLPGQPAFQVYDSSTVDGDVAALTFFALAPPVSSSTKDGADLVKTVATQIRDVWRYTGHDDWADKALAYKDYVVKNWSQEPYVSEDPNPTTVHPHPHPVSALAKSEWGGRLHFAGTETDLQSPGVMEGAAGAAARVATALDRWFSITEGTDVQKPEMILEQAERVA